MAQILIIEDEIEMAQGLKDNLEYEGFQVSLAYDGESGLKLAMEDSPDLILLDIMLPLKSGFDVCQQLRLKNATMPIIMLTARGQEIDKVLGLELGADDYITKPFSLRELLARIHAVLRRVSEKESKFSDAVQKMGKLIVDFNCYSAKDEKRDVTLTHKEFEILKFFRQHSGEAISREILIEKVWGLDVFPTTRTVDNHIAKLRKKIEPDPSRPQHILTVHGIGYKFIL